MNRLLFGDSSEVLKCQKLVPENVSCDPDGDPSSSLLRKPFSVLGKLLFPGFLQIGATFTKERNTSGDDQGSSTPSNSAHKHAPHQVPGLKLGALPPIFIPTEGSEVMSNRPGEPPTSKEFRRICSEVVTGQLFVSGWLVAEDWEQLQMFGITHVINTACAVSKCPFPDKISYLPLSIEDSKNEDVHAYFYVCFDFIERALQEGGRVLVHCMEGVSRSCTIAIAYLMWKRGISYNEAQGEIQKVRPICQPNAGFLCQLLDFQKRLEGSLSGSCFVRRVTARKFAGQFVLVGVNPHNEVDPRFAYISQENEKFTIYISCEISGMESQIRLAREVISRICRIEGISERNVSVSRELKQGSEPPRKHESLNFDAAACVEYLKQYQSPPLTHRSQYEEEYPFTARSRKSHGSIESERDSSVRVFVFQSNTLEGPIPHFDSDDLDSRSVFVFLSRTETTYVWVGNESHQTSPDVTFLRSSQDQECKEIIVVNQGTEPGIFWDLFREG